MQAEKWGLKPLEMEIWNGLVFIRFQAGPQPAVAEVLARFDDEIAPYDLANMVPTDSNSMDDLLPVNWKSVRDVDNEGYHVRKPIRGCINSMEMAILTSLTSMAPRDRSGHSMRLTVIAGACGNTARSCQRQITFRGSSSVNGSTLVCFPILSSASILTVSYIIKKYPSLRSKLCSAECAIGGATKAVK
jgi:hypothetical protein